METPSKQSKRRSIQFINDLVDADFKRFGNKANGLMQAVKLGASVAPGFTISNRLANRIAKSKRLDFYSNILTSYANRLALDVGKYSLFIIRSSSIFEDRTSATFSGLFDTQLNVKLDDGIASYVKSIVQSSRSPKLKPYFDRFGLDINSTHMAIVVQPQLAYEVGGIIKAFNDGFLVEYSTGKIEDAISGIDKLSSFYYRGGYCEKLYVLERDISLSISSITDSFINQSEFWQEIKKSLASVEFICVNGTLFVTQVNLWNSNSEIDSKYFSRVNPAENDVFSKTNAMEFLTSQRLFDMDCKILRSGWNFKQIKDAAKEILSNNKYITVRISSGSKLGLPRKFCATQQEVIEFVTESAKNTHDIILHGYIHVGHSMELLIFQNGFLLEYVPGMWESQNRLQPDAIFIKDGLETQYLYKEKREIVIDEKTNIAEKSHPPLSDDDIERLRSFGEKVWGIIKRNLFSKLPINLHAVSNQSLTTFQAINMRPGFNFDQTLTMLGDIKLIRNEDDLVDWRPNQRIRLSIATARGNESSLIPIAEVLAASDHPIIVDFGLLSHPAMILREYGCKLMPSYAVPACFEPGLYETRNLRHDFGLEPINRILSEIPLLSTENYHVVFDRDPVCFEHYLCTNRNASTSIVDSGTIEEVTSIYETISKKNEALFFEKGRAEYCTSAFTIPRDHFHVLTGIETKSAIAALHAKVGGTLHHSLASAYKSLGKEGPYVVFGCKSFGYYSSIKDNFQKRLLRSCIHSK